MNKLEKTIIWILEAARERKIKDLSKLQIQKLVYLIDVEYRRYSGESFFANSVSFYRQKLGPLSIQVYDALKDLDQSGCVKMTITDGAGYTAPRHGYSLSINPNQLKTHRLSTGEMVFVGSVLNDYVSLDQAKLKKIAYKTEPMERMLREETKRGKELNGAPLNMELIPLDGDLVKIIEG